MTLSTNTTQLNNFYSSINKHESILQRYICTCFWPIHRLIIDAFKHSLKSGRVRQKVLEGPSKKINVQQSDYIKMWVDQCKNSSTFWSKLYIAKIVIYKSNDQPDLWTSVDINIFGQFSPILISYALEIPIWWNKKFRLGIVYIVSGKNTPSKRTTRQSWIVSNLAGFRATVFSDWKNFSKRVFTFKTGLSLS